MSQKYDDLSREELVRLLAARDKRDATKFGLVWEANEIERDRAVNQDFVALDLDPELSQGEAPYRNLIIEGDNFDALRHLRMCYAGRVKCIYIDPPYNTGQSDFVYNDRFVDKEDLWKHSKWCEFLYQRLVLARDLLTQDGVLFCCINDKNRAKLELLIEKVFPGRFVSAFIWRTRSGANDSKEYFRSINHEHVLCFANPDFTFEGTAKTTEAYTNPDKDPRGPWNNDNLVKAHTYKQRANTFYPIQNPETEVWYPCDPDNVWRFSSEHRLKPGQTLRSKPMEQIIREKKVLWPQGDQTVCYSSKEELVAAIEMGTAPRNLRIGTTDEEKLFWDTELDFWVGKTMGYGKPRYKRHLSELKRSEKPFSSWLMPASLKKAERAELDMENAEIGIVGGTTGHAVLSLNEQDGGSRRFIMISNSEATEDNPDKNLCRDVCARRIRQTIKGYSVPTKKGPKEIEPLDGDFAYLRTRRIAPEKLLRIEHEQVWTALQMTHFDLLQGYDAGRRIQSASDGAVQLIYVSRYLKKDLPELERLIEGAASVIVYSWQPRYLANQFQSCEAQFEGIPESLERRFGLHHRKGGADV